MLHNLDTTEYYLETPDLPDGYELRVFVNGNGREQGHFVARRQTFKQIQAIHDYILARGSVTVSSVDYDTHSQRLLRTYTNIIRLEIIFPKNAT